MKSKKGELLKRGSKSNAGYTIEKEGEVINQVYLHYQAKDNTTGNRVIIKTLNPDFLETLDLPEQERLQNMFLNEALILSECKGLKHIVQADKPFIQNGVIYLPLEYTDGKSLEGRGTRILLERKALKYVSQISNDLASIHKKGLIHRAICPENILWRISEDGEVEAVLTNFGLGYDDGNVLTKTREAEVIPGYSSPECCHCGQPVGPFSDIYSLAATLYNLITGEVPLSANKRESKQGFLSGTEEITDPQKINPDITSRTAKAILYGMNMDSSKRPQSIQQWIAALKLPSDSSDLPSSSVAQNSTSESSEDMERKRFRFAQTVGIVAIAVTVVITFLMGLPAWLEWLEKNRNKPSTISPKNKTAEIHNVTVLKSHS